MRQLLIQRAAWATIMAFAACKPAVADSWMGGPPLNHPRGFAPTVVDECGNIYALGGLQRFSGGPSTVLNSVEQLPFDGSSYDTSWNVLGVVMPVGRTFHRVVCVGGFLYVIGGHDQSGDYVTAIDRYDLVSGAWDSSLPAMPSRVDHACVADRRGRIWVIGGVTGPGQPPTASVMVFDTARPQLNWQSMPSLNVARSGAGAIVDQIGRIWVIGGAASGAQHLRSVERLNTCSDSPSWETLIQQLPESQSPSNNVEAAIGADGFIYIVGGWDGWYSGRVARIDPRDPTSAWTAQPSLGLPRNEHSLVLGYDGRLIVVGGEAVDVTSQTSVETLYTGSCPGDLNFDRAVDLTDLTLFLSRFGAICP